MLTDNVGSSSVVRYDYQPFGQEILAGYDGRLTSMGYLGAPDDTNPKFTGQDRDVETGLDWFQVRYMSGAAGRFQSSDPGNAGADTSDPQMWNGFAYVGNNPLSFTDPSGQSWWSDLLGIGLEIAGFFLTGDPVLGTEIQAIGIGLEAAGSAVTLGGRIADSIGGGNSEGPAGLPGTQDPFGFPRGNGFTDCNANVQGCPQGGLQQQTNKDVQLMQRWGKLWKWNGPLHFIVATETVYLLTSSGAPWDFKNQPRLGAHPELDDFGNCHFGAIGRGTR
jgi:RHS repeat-associated protein